MKAGGLTWFTIPGASEPTLIADQQFVLYRGGIGLLECPSVMHPDDDDERVERSVGIFTVSAPWGFKLCRV